MDCFSSDDTEYFAFIVHDTNTLTDKQAGIHAADLRCVDKTFIVNMRDHQADLIDVAGEHEFEFRFGVKHGDAVAVDVCDKLIDMSFNAIAPNLRSRLFEPARTRRFKQLFHEIL
jgi:hypothetical protein